MRSLAALPLLLPAIASAAITFTSNDQQLRVPNQTLLNLGIPTTLPYKDLLNAPMYASTDFTVEAWIKPAESARDQSFKFILSKNHGGTGFALVMIGKNNDQRFHFESDSLASYGFQNGYNERAFRNKWFHIAGVRKGNKLFIFINGIFAAEADKPGPVRTNDLPLYIGSSPFQNSSFKGSIAEVRLWRTARTHPEIVHFMNRKLSGNEDSLVGYYPFDSDYENKTLQDYNSGTYRVKGRDALPVQNPPKFEPGPKLEPPLAEIAARSKRVNVEIDGQPVEVRKGGELFIMNGRAYAAACTISTQIGYSLSRYNGNRHLIDVTAPPVIGPTANSPRTILGTIPIGSLTCTINNKQLDLPEPAIVVDRSTPNHYQTETYYPLTFLTNLLGHKVKWDESTQTVQIFTKKQ